MSGCPAFEFWGDIVAFERDDSRAAAAVLAVVFRGSGEGVGQQKGGALGFGAAGHGTLAGRRAGSGRGAALTASRR